MLDIVPKKINNNLILYTKSTENFYSHNEDEEVKLSQTEINQLRDAYINCQQKLIVTEKFWLHRFTQKSNFFIEGLLIFT